MDKFVGLLARPEDSALRPPKFDDIVAFIASVASWVRAGIEFDKWLVERLGLEKDIESDGQGDGGGEGGAS